MKLPLFCSIFLFSVSLCPFPANPFSPSLNDDVLGLVFFKYDIQDHAGKLSSWNEEDYSPCDWAGVKCNPRSNMVTDLALDGFGLSGKLGRGLLQLKFLRTLSISKNNFTGTLNPTFAHLSNLTLLDLSENAFVGPIPNDLFAQCGSLRSVSVARNRLSGPIPETLASCSSLASLDFSGNLFSGQLPLGLWSLSGLRSIDLSDNIMLEGGISEGVGNLKNLRALRLRNNKLSGEVPDGIGDCLSLKTIDLGRNSFSGGLQSTMQKLSLCSDLILSGNGFTGFVPEWIGEMRSLEILDLSGNNFSGPIPDSFGMLWSLKLLNVSDNALVGSLPESMSTCENLSTLDGSRNSLTGDFPSWVFKLGLQLVLVSENGLSGSLESAFRSSSEVSRANLLVLDVSRNKLTGEIPSEVGNFESLNVLDLSENRLNGNIPLEIGSVASLISLSLAHNEITGPIPVTLANLTRLETVNFSFNKLTGSLPKQLANLVSLHSFNISYNQIQGELPSGPFFNTIDPSSVSANPALCGASANRTCSAVLPKPIVLNPNSTDPTTPDNNNSIPPTFGRGKKILSISALIAIGAAAAIVVGVIAVTVLNLRVRGGTAPRSVVALDFTAGGGGYDFSRSPSTDGASGKLVMFSGDPNFSSGTHALLNKDCELGRGGYGAVYKTVLGDGRPVAIKKLTVSSLVKSQDDFEREVKKLGKARHDNLVHLDGYYWTPSLQLLIYEFISGGNLYKHLHEKSSGGDYHHLTWNGRFNIILGAARGLAHLHRMNIIHYNLKSSNILISDSGEPKVSDYGLARLLPMLDRYVLSSKIQSALGYMAPEFACKTVKITEKCDVYGFGILVLEILTGRRPVEYMEDDVVVLSDMVRGAMEEGKVEECIDFRLQGKFPVEEVLSVVKLGLICMSQVPSARPDMTEVVNILELIRCPSEGLDSLGDFS